MTKKNIKVDNYILSYCIYIFSQNYFRCPL